MDLKNLQELLIFFLKQELYKNETPPYVTKVTYGGVCVLNFFVYVNFLKIYIAHIAYR